MLWGIKFCCFGGNSQTFNTSTKIFSTYHYNMIVLSKLQTLNPQTSLFTANHKIQLLQTFPAIRYMHSYIHYTLYALYTPLIHIHTLVCQTIIWTPYSTNVLNFALAVIQNINAFTLSLFQFIRPPQEERQDAQSDFSDCTEKMLLK